MFGAMTHRWKTQMRNGANIEIFCLGTELCAGTDRMLSREAKYSVFPRYYMVFPKLKRPARQDWAELLDDPKWRHWHVAGNCPCLKLRSNLTLLLITYFARSLFTKKSLSDKSFIIKKSFYIFLNFFNEVGLCVLNLDPRAYFPDPIIFFLA